ncbi:2-amino-4-hydroxy-6-hydroxymethyldihydropteridine diphosphokinase [Bifidobacterium sp. 64T4]|uniref:2-amino-4-hydroxy-6- hydroxymethyldihydropteridine diphosphokinase n=1 Tax=Bifidobacterium pongonis TaxID=2834432 RepID=UPI001C567CCA|nr:2-amino-4-hydroxy-6-hydroxymethyldihydropteridine diphosphokinase [Bifidobacterium pongonis]MBW3094860.1 2-amino-4-hydroxy-6-hydroxymethyldihydropteridine diphosphokinase [Bifidobacterium pongonis]
MDRIVLTGVRANGTHGVLDFEHERAQQFIVDATLYLDLAAAGVSDDLNDTVDYGRAAKEIVAVIEGRHADLIEHLAQRIADRLLAIPPIAKVDVTVHKPHAPITVPFDDVAVSITRSKENAKEGTERNAGKNAKEAGCAPATHHAVIAIGGNQGDVEATLRDAVRRIDALGGTQVTGVSPLYRTVAWGMPDGTPDFLNAVVEVSTTLDAYDLLDGLHGIENDHGRKRETHWSSRTLDLDIIDYDGVESDDTALTLPHPRAWQRAFVLVPWAALDPEADLPGMHGGPVGELADGLLDEADEPPVEFVASDWLSGGSGTRGSRHGIDRKAKRETGRDAKRNADRDAKRDGQGKHDSQSKRQPRHAADGGPGASGASAGTAGASDGLQARTAVISLESVSTEAENLFREAIVTIDGIPGSQVEGISPLYHVGNLDGPDAMSAVVQILTKLGPRELIEALEAIESMHGKAVDLDLVDMQGVVSDEPDCRVPWPSAGKRAAVLAPWMDMDPNATLDGDPVSFLLAMAQDAGRVGMLSDAWIFGADAE